MLLDRAVTAQESYDENDGASNYEHDRRSHYPPFYEVIEFTDIRQHQRPGHDDTYTGYLKKKTIHI